MTCATEHSFFWQGLQTSRYTRKAWKDIWIIDSRVDNSRIKYTPKGLAWLNNWGSLRYATTTAFLAAVYADWEGCSPQKAKIYNDFAKAQV